MTDDLTQFITEIEAERPGVAALRDRVQREYFVDELVGRRKRLNLTQAEVAERMGVTQATVSQFEAEGGNDPKLSTLQRYARAVNSLVILRVRHRGDTALGDES